MNLRLLCFSGWILSGALSLCGQENIPGNYLQLQSGWCRYQIRDTKQTPFTYRKAGIPLQLSYLRTNVKLTYGVQLYFDQETLNNEWTPGTLEAILGRMEALVQFRSIALSFAGIEVWLGGTWKNQFLDRDFLFRAQSPEFSTTSQRSSLEAFSSLNLMALVSRTIGAKHGIDAHLKWGFLAYLVSNAYNPQHFGELKDNDTFLFANDFLDLETGFAYHFLVSPHFDVSLMYLFRHYEYDRFFVSEFGNQQLLLGAGLKF